MVDNQSFYANGKLLLTGEYFVLEGAEALALPTKQGQSLTVNKNKKPNFGWDSEWYSFDADGDEWFSCGFDAQTFNVAWSSGENIHEQLMIILKTASQLAKLKLKPNIYETNLTFPRTWGLGTSSTLIYNIAAYFKINPYLLLEKTFGGSGYDIACAGAKTPIIFQKKNDKPIAQSVDFKPPFSEYIYFIYLNKKQNSREGIARFKEKSNAIPPQLKSDIGHLTQAFLNSKTLKEFDDLIVNHENIIASVIEMPRAKSLYFNDFWGEIKSLGAWGGDFVMATSDRNEEETRQYFQTKGFSVFLKYEEIIL